MQSNRAFIANHPTQIQFKTLKHSGNYTAKTNCLTTGSSQLCTYVFIYVFYAFLPVVLYGWKFWALTMREESRPYVFENSVLKKILGTKRDEVGLKEDWRILHNEELRDFHFSPNIIWRFNHERPDARDMWHV